jgi:hypothetical protein
MLRLHIASGELWFPDRNHLAFFASIAAGAERPMRRKILIASILPIVSAAGCQTLERLEVWKQQTFFSPPPALTVSNGDPCAPAAPCNQPTQPYYSGTTTTKMPVPSVTEFAPDDGVPADSAPSLGPAGSPEVINSVLE